MSLPGLALVQLVQLSDLTCSHHVIVSCFMVMVPSPSRAALETLQGHQSNKLVAVLYFPPVLVLSSFSTACRNKLGATNIT